MRIRSTRLHKSTLDVILFCFPINIQALANTNEAFQSQLEAHRDRLEQIKAIASEMGYALLLRV